MNRTHVCRLAAAAAIACSSAAQAALPTVSLSFTQPTGTVGPGDKVDVFVTLTVESTSSPLVFDATSPAPFGFAAADLPAQGHYIDSATYGSAPADFATYTYVQTNTAFSCSGTFTNACAPAAYSFDFHLASEPGRPSVNFLPALNLQPGQSFTYLFGTFTPVGTVAPGTYTFYGTYLSLEFSGLDANGHDLFAGVDLGSSCPLGENAQCAFTRTVVAVPELQTSAMMALGMLGLAAGARRRRRGH